MNIDEAINYSANALGHCLSQQECAKQLNYFTENFKKSLTKESQDIWRKQIKKIEDWQSSTDFKNGNFPHGIDELILELVEWRALIFSLQNTDTEKNPFGKYFFMEQWSIGGTYAIFSLLTFGASLFAHKLKLAIEIGTKPSSLAGSPNHSINVLKAATIKPKCDWK